MLVFIRDRDYPELLRSVRGRKVAVWTCNTCARLCNGIGGTGAAERLAEALTKDGIDVVGVLSVSASCLEEKICARLEKEPLDEADVIISLACDSGSLCASRLSGKEVINPLITLGRGHLSKDNVPVLTQNGRDEAYPIGRNGSDPFV